MGDCAAIRDPRTGKVYPPTAQHALRQGKVVARNLQAAICGGTEKPFVYSTLGQLAAIGKRTGVANILGLNFSGFLAWFLWRTIDLSKLPSLEKRVRVALQWILDLFFKKDLIHYSPPHASGVPHLDGAASVGGTNQVSTQPYSPNGRKGESPMSQLHRRP